MTQKQLFQIIGTVDDDLVEEAARSGRDRPPLRLIAVRMGALAACLALIAGLGISRLYQPVPQLLPRPAATRMEGIAPFSSPASMRKFFNFDGYRYAFLDDGAPYDLSDFTLNNCLGKLEYDIVDGMSGMGDNEYVALDRATTFALNGEIYELPGYSPAFRLAVLSDGECYLAELVGRVDNLPLEPGYYFEVSSLESLVKRIDILPHMGGEALHSVSRRGDRLELLHLLAQAEIVQLSSEDYQAIASAQGQGRSWQMEALLTDGTGISFYITPQLGFVSIGDSTYRLPDEFLTQFGDVFENLPQLSPPLSGR